MGGKSKLNINLFISRCALLVFSLAFSSSFALAKSPVVVLVGLDSKLHSSSVEVSNEDFDRMMHDTLLTVQDSMLSSLNSAEHSQGRTRDFAETFDAAPSPYWMLRTLVVGVAASVNAGLGPIFSVSATPRIRLIFTNSTDPTLP
jgi:hypothetical protein